MKSLKLDSNGFHIAIAVHEPKQAPKTAVILCPGYLDSKDYPHLVSLAEAFAAKGMLAVRLDPVGTWGSSGSEADYSFTRYLKNTDSVREWITKTYGIKELIMAGHSLGGLVSMVAAARQQAVKAVIALCAPTQMTGTADPHWQKDNVRVSTRVFADGDGERTYRVPWAFAEDVSQYSAIIAVQRYKSIPLLLVAGSDDTVIPPAEVRAIYDTAHEPKKFVQLEIEHNYRNDRRQTNLVANEVINWVSSLNL